MSAGPDDAQTFEFMAGRAHDIPCAFDIYRNSVSDITACAQISELEHNRHIKDV